MGRHKSYDRGAVLDRALKLFWEKGYEGAHLQELVEVTGLNRFSLYKEFGSKEGLFEEAFEKYVGDLGSLAQFLTRQPRGLDNIRQYLQAVSKYPWHQGCFAVNALTHHPALPARNQKRIFRLFKDLEQMIHDNLAAAQESDELDRGMDVQVLARLILAFDIGLIVYHILNPKREIKGRMVAIVNDLLLSPQNKNGARAST